MVQGRRGIARVRVCESEREGGREGEGQLYLEGGRGAEVCKEKQ